MMRVLMIAPILTVLRALIDNCLWFIWKVRNDTMHNHNHIICKPLSPVYKAAARTYDISHFSDGRKWICQLQVKWEFPPLRWNKRNVDGSWNHDLNEGETGFVLRNEIGNCCFAGCNYTQYQNRLICEFLALKQGLEICLKEVVQRVFVESASSIVTLHRY